MKNPSHQIFQQLLIIRELTGLKLNLSKTLRTPMTPQDHKAEVEDLKTRVMASALTQVHNCSSNLRSLVDSAFNKATRANNRSVQGKLSQASMRLNEFLEIMKDPEIQAIVRAVNEEDIRSIRGSLRK